MIRPRRDDAETPADHWKNKIVQKTSSMPTRADFKPKSGSTAKGRRRWSVIARLGVYTLFFGAVATVGVLAWEDYTGTASVPRADQTLEFESDGVITKEWVRELFGADKRLPPILDMKRRLEDIPQIREVSVRRLPGDGFAIRIAERRAVMRLRVKLPDGNLDTRLVASDGVIYTGINVGQMTFSNLPLLVAPKLRKEKTHDVVEDFAKVATFLDTARERYPSVYRDWQSVSLKDYVGRNDAPGSVLRVKPRLNTQAANSAAIVEIVFSPEDYMAELDTLADRGFAEMLRQALENAYKNKFTAYRLDLSMVNSSNPRYPVPEPRLIPVPATQRQP